MKVTREMQYFAVARLANRLEDMADSYDILMLDDIELDSLSGEIREAARKMRNHCFKILDSE